MSWDAQCRAPMDRPPHVSFPVPVTEQKGWGQEIILINHPDYCAKVLCFAAGQDGSAHFHRDKHETWRVLEGELTFLWIDTECAEEHTKVLKAGDMVDIPRLCPHKVTAITDCRIMEVSTPHYSTDSFRMAKGASQRVVAVA